MLVSENKDWKPILKKIEIVIFREWLKTKIKIF